MATKTAIITLCEEAIFIWAIKPLSPQLPDFFNPTHVPLLLTLPYPDFLVNGDQSLPGILVLHNVFISTTYVKI